MLGLLDKYPWIAILFFVAFICACAVILICALHDKKLKINKDGLNVTGDEENKADGTNININMSDTKNNSSEIKNWGRRKEDKDPKILEKEENDVVQTAVIISNEVSKYHADVEKMKEKDKNDVIHSCIVFANNKIEDAIYNIQNSYLNVSNPLKESLSSEDNYRLIIFGLVLDQLKESFKDIICRYIREDHFESKSEAEIKSISDECINKGKKILNNAAYGIDKSVIIDMDSTLKSEIKSSSEEIIDNAAERYKKYKKDIEEKIQIKKETTIKSIKAKSSIISDEVAESLMN